ncbi:hypothetical protein D9615_001876 [Tricholomella constricta]|uniref:PhoD-like phosphatase domain-containing protein n=1 Tax=Tricholomella constricta TaxID=117010 RepID=A0A8H5HPD2_9AGAR|nr:hypothetical protein D9615_001876 [Tricholomella constricta]
MDVPGWHAQRRARREDELLSIRRPDSRYSQAEDISPMHENFIGGFNVAQLRPGPHPQPPPSPQPPALPPKDLIYTQPGYHLQQPSYHAPQPGYHLQQPSYHAPQPGYHGQQPSNHSLHPTQSTVTSSQLTHLSAVERSQTLRVARMNPHLQFMVGPLLRYDTVDELGIWHGAAMIVTADSGSIYEPHPTLTYEWDPDRNTSYQNAHLPRSFDLGPHPADPHSTVLPTSPILPSHNMFFNGDGMPPGSNASKEIVPGQEIYVYGGPGGYIPLSLPNSSEAYVYFISSTFTFWRFLIQIPLGPHEMSVTYNINSGQQLEFFVPGRAQNMRWAAHSCNGFSAGVNQDDFCGPGFKSGYDPVWIDLLSKHAETPFHTLVGGGDQLYCDSLMREPELQEWISRMKPEEKRRFALTDEIAATIDRFYFNHYCQSFRRGAFARANSSMCTNDEYVWYDIDVPENGILTEVLFQTITVKFAVLSISTMQLTIRLTYVDTDIIDGFGSYPDELQRSPMFQTIGERGYFYFLLFQCFINPTLDGYSDKPGQHVSKSAIIGDDGPYVRSRSHSFLGYLGPQCYILLLDCRGERKKDQICSPLQYQKVFHRLAQLPSSVEHLIVQVGIPIAYPRMVFLETALESKFNPLVALGRTGSLGLSGFVNKFNAEAELLDDLNDHWTARSHKRERNWLIEQLQLLASRQRIRVTFVSGDVHCAAVGVLKTLKAKGKHELTPAVDYRYMLNIVTSAIVNTPPPNPVISMVSSLATKVHKTLHHIETDETMMPIFQAEPNGQARKQKFIMGRRNWCKVVWDPHSGDVVFDIRVEKEKGLGETVGYSVRAPPPGWGRGN